jgi:hypothetical protein
LQSFKFPFGIYFQLEENQILIVAVIHTSQDPKKVELNDLILALKDSADAFVFLLSKK